MASLLLQGLVLLLPLLVAGQTSTTSTSSTSSVVDYLLTANFTNLVTAITGVEGLLDILSGDGPYTVLAPRDEGWTGINTTKLLQPGWSRHLSDLILYHVSMEQVILGGTTGREITMLNDDTTVVTATTTSASSYEINNIPVRTPDVMLSNGVVQILDQVLQPRSVSQSLVDAAYVTPEVSVLASLLFEADDLATVLQGPGPFTIFAPNNDAFSKLNGTAFGNAIESETEKNPFGILTRILNYHVVPGIHLVSDFLVASSARNSAASTSTSNIFRQAQQPAAGIVSDFSTTLQTLGGLDMQITLNPSTSTIRINNNATVMQSDILVSNGVLHIIDSVLFPVVRESSTTFDSPKTVLDVAVQDDTNAGLTAFADAVIKASMARTLSRNTPLTVFVPNDDAFASTPGINMTELMTDPWSAHLRNLLSFHVLEGASLYADNFTMGMLLPMLNEEDMNVTSAVPNMAVNGVSIREPDLDQAANGILHIIPQVLLPQAFEQDLVEAASARSELTTMVDLIGLAELLETLQRDGPFTIFAPVSRAFDRLEGSPMGDAILPKEESMSPVVAGNNTNTNSTNVTITSSSASTTNITSTSTARNPFGIVTGFLKYHVVEGLYSFSALEKLTSGTELETANGAHTVKIHNNNGLPLIGTYNATILEADILCKNGVIHIINSVIFPAAAVDLVYTDNLLLDTQSPTDTPPTPPPTLAPTPAPTPASNMTLAVVETSTTAPVDLVSTPPPAPVENTSGGISLLTSPLLWSLLLPWSLDYFSI